MRGLGRGCADAGSVVVVVVIVVIVVVRAHGVSWARLYQPFSAPTITIGPVGLFDPPAGSIDTANAVTSLGRSSFASCVT